LRGGGTGAQAPVRRKKVCFAGRGGSSILGGLRGKNLHKAPAGSEEEEAYCWGWSLLRQGGGKERCAGQNPVNLQGKKGKTKPRKSLHAKGRGKAARVRGWEIMPHKKHGGGEWGYGRRSVGS